MARSKGKSTTSSHSSYSRPRRDHSTIAKPSGLLAVSPSPLAPVVTPRRSVLPPSTDRRFFHPEKRDQPAKSIAGTIAPITVKNRPVPRTHKFRKLAVVRFGSAPSQTKAAPAFVAPQTVAVCIRRKRRKEVLFAKKRAGKGGMRKPRRSWLSKISCR